MVSHWVYSPRSHIQQWPQEIWNGMETRSPTFRSPVSPPTSTTSPIVSWPSTSPTAMNGASGSTRCRSEPQMLVVVTRMTASVGCWMTGSGTSSTRTSPLPCQVTAFMGYSSVARIGRARGLQAHPPLPVVEGVRNRVRSEPQATHSSDMGSLVIMGSRPSEEMP